jgi:hypothetical protein
MDWNVVRAGMNDELEKISISLMGFSPESVLHRQEAEPMQTEGLSKAMKILQKADQYDLHSKTAGAVINRVGRELIEYMAKKETQKRLGKHKIAWARKALQDTDNRYEKIRPWVNRGLAGAGAGTLLTGLTSAVPSLKHRLIGAGIGASASLADHAYARHRKHVKNVKGGMIKKSFMANARGARSMLSNSRLAGSFKGTIRGPGIKSQSPKITNITLPKTTL